MKQLYSIIGAFFLFLVFIFDSQLSTLLSNWAPERVVIASHLLLIFLIYSVRLISILHLIIIFLVIGATFDIYYLGILGVGVALYPLLTYFVYYFHKGIGLRRIINFIILLVLIFSFEFTSFLIAKAFQMTNLSVFIFTSYSLLPTLIFNLLLFMLIQPLLEKYSLFLRRNKNVIIA